LFSLYALRTYLYYISKLLAKAKTYWPNSHFPICNQKLIFAFVFPSSFYINNDDNNNTKTLILKRPSKFFNGIHAQKYETKSSSKIVIIDTMIDNSIIMTTCMSSFSNLFLKFDSFKTFNFCFAIFLQTFQTNKTQHNVKDTK
jgi:hypothetical protein